MEGTRGEGARAIETVEVRAVSPAVPSTLDVRQPVLLTRRTKTTEEKLAGFAPWIGLGGSFEAPRIHHLDFTDFIPAHPFKVEGAILDRSR